MFFDEFAVYDRPSIFYAWAERNTRPSVPSDERQRHKLNGLLCVDALTGEQFLRLSEKAKTEDISLYLAELCLDSIELGFNKLSIILDNNTTHKQKMRWQLAEHLKQMGLAHELTVEFIHLPAYSPKLNARRVCDSFDSITLFAPFTNWYVLRNYRTSVREVFTIVSVSQPRTSAKDSKLHLCFSYLIFWWEGSNPILIYRSNICMATA